MDDENNTNIKVQEIPEGMPHCDQHATRCTADELNLLCLELAEAIDEVRQLLEAYLRQVKHPKKHKWMTSYEVQNHLRVSKQTLKRYRETRQIRFITFKGQFRYHYDDVKEMLDFQRKDQ